MNQLFSLHTLRAGLIVGTLDILAAFIQYFIRTNKNPAPVLKFIASGVFGNDAFTAGDSMLIWGLIFHYLIACIFTIFFFFLCGKIPSLLKMRLLTGIIYGAFIWTVMQFCVLPLSRTPSLPFDPLRAIPGILILIVCIGIPLSYMAGTQRTT